LRRLREAGIAVFAIAGNHDSPRSYSYGGGAVPQEEADALGAICLFRNTEELRSQEVTIRGQHVRIWGMSADFNRPDDVCPLESLTLERAAPDTIQIVLLHYNVEGLGTPFAEEPTLSRCNLERLQADAICVGHLHRRMQTYLDGGALLVNPGATEHIDFGEEGLECGFTLLQLAPGRAEAEHIGIPTQPMRTLEIELTPEFAQSRTVEQEAEAATQWMEAVRARITAVSHQDQLLRVRFVGQIPRGLFHALDLEELLRHGNAENFHCQFDRERMLVYDPDSDVPLGYGVSFDVAEELQNVANGLRGQHNDDPVEQELYALAAEQVRLAFGRLTKGAR